MSMISISMFLCLSFQNQDEVPYEVAEMRMTPEDSLQDELKLEDDNLERFGDEEKSPPGSKDGIQNAVNSVLQGKQHFHSSF